VGLYFFIMEEMYISDYFTEILGEIFDESQRVYEENNYKTTRYREGLKKAFQIVEKYRRHKYKLLHNDLERD
jgi:hypothetical protein